MSLIPRSITRRVFVGSMVGGAASGLVGPALSYDPSDEVKAAARALTRSRSIIGRSYLAACREDADANRLYELIRLAVGAVEPTEGNAASFQVRFDQAVSNDFEKGDTIWLDGWLLSKTEARLCALSVVSIA